MDPIVETRLWMERSKAVATILMIHVIVSLICYVTTNPLVVLLDGNDGCMLLYTLITGLCLILFVLGVYIEHGGMRKPMIIKQGIDAILSVLCICILIFGFWTSRKNGFTIDHMSLVEGVMAIFFVLAPFHILIFYCFYMTHKALLFHSQQYRGITYATSVRVVVR